MNTARLGRAKVPLVTSQLNIRPVFDVNADVQGIDLATAATAIDKVLAANAPPEAKATHVTLAGQVETMRESFNGLFSGMAVAVVLVYLILVINFQSWIDPLIVLSAVPFAIGGVLWILFLTSTHISVPALMGTLMHRPHDGQQHPRCHLRQSADDGRRQPLRRRLRPANAIAAGPDDGGRHDPRHDPDGPWRR
jgi:hypothetical protein